MRLATVPAFFAYNGLVVSIYQGFIRVSNNNPVDNNRFLQACVFTVICLGIVAGASMIESGMRK